VWTGSIWLSTRTRGQLKWTR